MIVDCESCPGQHLAPPACPTCVVRLLLDQQPPSRSGAPPWDLALAPEARPVPVELVRRTDDEGALLDAREQRAVAVLTACGLLPGLGRAPGGRRSAARTRSA